MIFTEICTFTLFCQTCIRFAALPVAGGVNLPESNAGRTFVSCWWLFCIVIVATYCGNLIAFLTVTKETAPFNTLDEMVEYKVREV